MRCFVPQHDRSEYVLFSENFSIESLSNIIGESAANIILPGFTANKSVAKFFLLQLAVHNIKIRR